MTRLVGIDGGLATSGIVIADGAVSFTRSRHFFSELRVLCVDTFASVKNGSIDVHDDRASRLESWIDWMVPMLEEYRPAVAFVEQMSFPRGANPIAMICLSWGALVTLLRNRGIGRCAVGPKVWRHGLTPRARGTTEQRERAAHREALKRVPSYFDHARHISKGRQVHALDALGVLAWGAQHWSEVRS